jgi:hypothetical protein
VVIVPPEAPEKTPGPEGSPPPKPKPPSPLVIPVKTGFSFLDHLSNILVTSY